MIQYTDYSSIPSTIQNIVANKCKLLDQYILFQTGRYEYTALIHNPVTKETNSYTFTRNSDYGGYTVQENSATWDYTLYNEYYCYSNVGYGSSLNLPVVQGATAHSTVVLVCVLMLAIMFKGALFPCLRKR